MAQVLREALARGADRAIHVESDALAGADAFVVAAALAGAMKDERFDLVLTGLQSDDQGFGADRRRPGRDGWGCRTRRSSWKCRSTSPTSPGAAAVKRELEGGWFQWVAMPLPALLTIQSGINQLRYATLKGIMAAKKKEIRKARRPRLRLWASRRSSSLYVPEKSKKTQMIAGSPAEAAKELVRRLREEARVI